MKRSYLFKSESLAGGDAFVCDGFRGWNRPEALQKHVGGHMSAHNQAMGRLEDFKNQKASIVTGKFVRCPPIVKFVAPPPLSIVTGKFVRLCGAHPLSNSWLRHFDNDFGNEGERRI